LLTPLDLYLPSSSGYEITPSLTSGSVLKGAQCTFLDFDHGVGHPGCLWSTPQHFSTGGKERARTPTKLPILYRRFRPMVASPPRGKRREKHPERHTYCVPAALGDVFPISTINPGKKDWISLLKKTNLETNSFILKDAVGHTKGYFKSAELTGTYAVLVSNRVD
jgi:hypothetical protein